jgi:hypothetical protein
VSTSPDLRPIRDKTLQELEGKDWGEPSVDSHVVTERHRLRRVPLKRLRIEDLRLLVGQGDGWPFLVPRALEHLKKHPFAEGDFYPGDLLKNVATVDEAFWLSHPELRKQLIRALERAVERIHKVGVPEGLPAELRSYLANHRAAAGGAP